MILASASYDGKALIWREENGQWSNIAQHSVHTGSINSVQWAPQEYGALLLCASSDGKVSVVEYKDEGKPEHVIFPAHSMGVNSASWAPSSVTGSLVQSQGQTANQEQPRRIVTGGCDNKVNIWKYDGESKTYVKETSLEGHTDWVRDVAWSPSVLSKSYIASASQDKTVIIWTQEGNEPWKKKLLKTDKFADVVWRVSCRCPVTSLPSVVEIIRLPCGRKTSTVNGSLLVSSRSNALYIVTLVPFYHDQYLAHYE